MTQVFISYSRKDLAFIEQLAVDLKVAGLDVWYDLSGLGGGVRWSREIEKAIKASLYVIVVLSPDSVASTWVEEETLYARNLKRKIVPLLYRPADLPLGFYSLNFIDVQGDIYLQNYKEILRALDIKHSDRESAEKVVREKVRLEAEEEEKRLIAKEKAEHEATEKAAREKARLKAEEFARQKAAKEKAEREAAEKAAHEKAKRERVERWSARKTAIAKNFSEFILKYQTGIRSTLVKLQGKTVFVLSFTLLVAIVSLVFYVQVTTPPLFFSAVSGGELNVYSYKDKAVARITSTTEGVENWYPVNGFGGDIYFTSDRTGKAEIHGFNTDTGKLWQITDTAGQYESWSPSTGWLGGDIYFTSDRTGKAEIYGFNTSTGKLWQITDTAVNAQSWSLVVRGQNKYYTSDRSGVPKVYLLGPNEVAISELESWTKKLSDRFPDK